MNAERMVKRLRTEYAGEIRVYEYVTGRAVGHHMGGDHKRCILALTDRGVVYAVFASFGRAQVSLIPYADARVGTVSTMGGKVTGLVLGPVHIRRVRGDGMALLESLRTGASWMSRAA